MRFVVPKTYLVGVSSVDLGGFTDYLTDTGNEDFMDDFNDAVDSGVSEGEALCSFYAKLCYKSLTIGKNANLAGTRDIRHNLEGCISSGHGSVFEHCWLNFVTTDCSRVFTHELVRHRVGTAFSQTSGRFVALDRIDFIMDPILGDVADDVREVVEFIERKAVEMREKLRVEEKPLAVKKKITSAIRRIAPNGQANEIGWSANIRSLRHTIEMRTSRHAEWEIRTIFAQVAAIVKERWPMILHGGECGVFDELPEWTGLRV